MTKNVFAMTDSELMEAYSVGKKWLIKNEQVTRTYKNAEGNVYEEGLYLMGLSRIEDIENEMNKRRMKYAQ